jgi:predicted MPP superfamily phosphohydrolase
VVTFIHLSDIHFLPRDKQAQLDLDIHIRRALLDDLETKPANGAPYDALLITGDIAFSGKPKEYKTAQDWLDQLFARSGLSRKETYMVPGNHDVDRDYVEPDLPLWASHVSIRSDQNPVKWRDAIAKQLRQDPLHSLLAPLKTYNDFAQGYDCTTKPDQLAWCRLLPKSLEDGRVIRLHGLNSAMISDSGDAPGQLLVSEFQTSHFERTPNTVDVVLCHHPPDWLMDKEMLRNALKSFAPISLFGHEHSMRIEPEKKNLRLFAGAVQPSRRDPANWLPTYHILQLSTSTESDFELVVHIHTREFDARNFKFRPGRNEDDEPVEQHRLTIPNRVSGTQVLVSVPDSLAPSSQEEGARSEASMSTKMEIAKRELLVRFFRLKTPDRYASAFEAGLLRDGDDALPPQTMWSEVFKRASSEQGGLAKFWSTVASRDPELTGTHNPFVEE